MVKQQDELSIGYREYFEMCDELLRAIRFMTKHGCPEVNHVVAIARGGLFFGAYAACKLDLPIDVVYAKSYEGTQRGKLTICVPQHVHTSGKRVLLCDDIVDTNRTLKAVYEELKLRGGEIVPVTLFRKRVSGFPMVDKFAEYTEKWITFWYDPDLDSARK